MKRRNAIALAAALTSVSPAAWCAFVCKPPGSSTIIRDYPPPECAGVEIRELNPDGSLKHIIAPPLTAEQKKEKTEKERRQAECIKGNQAQTRDDDALLGRYLTEDDLLHDRDIALARERTRIDRQDQKLKELKVDRKRLDDEAEFYAKREMPKQLKVRFDDNDAAKARAEHEIGVIGSQMQSISDQFDAKLKRYRDLVAGTAQPPHKCEE